MDRFSTKALARNPGVYLRQGFRRFQSLSDLLEDLTNKRPIAIVQIGANDGEDALGDLIRNRSDRIASALLIEPQRAAFDRLVERIGECGVVVCLNVAIDRQAGERTLYSVGQNDQRQLGDSIASFDRRHVESEIRHVTRTYSDSEIDALIATEKVQTILWRRLSVKDGRPTCL